MLHLTDGELDELVAAPAWTDVVRERPLLVVSADGGTASTVTTARMAAAPCVVVGIDHDPADPPVHVDAVVDPSIASLDAIAETVTRAPIAAAALVLLLRAGPAPSVPAGLAAESAVYSMLQAGPEFAEWRASYRRHERPPDDRPPVRLERDGDTLRITLDRPSVGNALNVAMRDGLLEAFELVGADPSIERAVWRGEGRSFCTGGDLDEFGSFEDPASAHLVRLATSIGLAIDRVADRVTVELHGSCAGSGIELPAFASRVVAAPDTTFALPELSLGLVPGAGGTVSLVRRAGRHRVALLALSGRTIDATTALEWGVVDAVGGDVRGSRPSPSGR